MHDDGADFTPAGDRLRWIRLGGSGPDPVVFVHGLGCHGAASWAETARRLGRPAIVLDLPGHGRSDRPREYDYSLESLADAVAAAIRAVAPGAVDLVSHSLGGTIAIVLAARHPDLVRRSVLVEPGIDRREIAPGDIAAFTDEELLGDGWGVLLERETASRRAEIRLTDPIALRRCAVSITDALGGTVGDLLASAAVPTTLVRGGARSYDDGARFARAGVTERVLGRAGHFVMLDEPDAFVELLDEAFGTTPRA